MAPTDPRTAAGKTFPPSARWRAKWLGLDESAHPEVATLALAAEQFAMRAIRNDPAGPRLLVLGGRPGTGKTHVAKAISRFFNALAVTAWSKGWWTSHEVPAAVLVEWMAIAESDPHKPGGLWDEAIGANLLVVDDMGAEVDRYKSGLPVANLARLLNARERRWNVITTNYPPESWEDHYDKRVADRLRRRAVLVEIKEAPSYWQSLARAA